MAKNLSIAFVRRGYSPTGGAEVYLKRLAHGVAASVQASAPGRGHGPPVRA